MDGVAATTLQSILHRLHQAAERSDRSSDQINHRRRLPMSIEDNEESLEHTLLVVREVFVFKIPPRSTSGDYKCNEWLQSDKIWTSHLLIVSCHDRCKIHLVSKFQAPSKFLSSTWMFELHLIPIGRFYWDDWLLSWAVKEFNRGAAF
ncbi:hypothetical protein RHSIM_Rhsim12G0095200 [Rhododendron simsii]|uniref:NECAP PHear domain-containing protein n=1 Tax=Rhododendron simsii TaxID=118357 RepID=A0A834G4K2_RHOSS|nr:hypothetical protein RHSIM_Rhsim12G0095200 [Rhododendron simsii]